MKRFMALTAVVVLFASAHPAWASKGNQNTGYGPIQEAMAGASVAAPLDAFTIVSNPAGMTKVPGRVDFAVGGAMPVAHMDTSAAPAGNAAAGEQKSEFTIFPLPFIATTWGFLDDRLVVGLAFVQNGGSAVSYKQSRFNPLVTGNTFDTYIDYRFYKFVPAVAYKILDNLSLGLGFQLGYATFSSDSILTGTLTETAGRGRSENGFGFAGSLGLLYEPIPELSLAFNYTSRMKFQKFGKYNDLLGNNSLDAPHQVQAGIAGRPFDSWLIEADFHWMHWSDIPIYGQGPVSGGLGWRDTYYAGIGTEYSPIDRVHLRAGYGFQTAVVRSDTVFANAITPFITEHNFNAGIGVDATDHLALNAAWGMALKNSKTQTGGDAVSVMGTGTKSQYSGQVVVLGASYKWGE